MAEIFLLEPCGRVFFGSALRRKVLRRKVLRRKVLRRRVSRRRVSRRRVFRWRFGAEGIELERQSAPACSICSISQVQASECDSSFKVLALVAALLERLLTQVQESERGVMKHKVFDVDDFTSCNMSSLTSFAIHEKLLDPRPLQFATARP